ncbi:MAG: potassium channel family protein [Gammaproteobacteria bacterium]|nr:potassium channel family protein [Gammaproteobacteria bacterium]
MPRRLHLSFLDYHSGKYFYLLLLLLIWLIGYPLVANFPIARIAFSVLLTLTLLASVYAVSQKGHVVRTGLVLAILTFIFEWSAFKFQFWWLEFATVVLFFLFSAYITGMIVLHVVRQRRVTMDEIFAAISAYLMIGMTGALLFVLIDQVVPGSLSVSSSLGAGGPEVMTFRRVDFPTYLYYGFVTLTTLGYGDINPVSAPARVFSYLLAVTGQIYLTVLIAWLVGLYISQSRKE